MSYFVPELNQSYTWDEDKGVITFSDGVEYSVSELIELSRVNTTVKDKQAVHRLKKAFDGELLPKNYKPKHDRKEFIRKHLEYYRETGFISPRKKREFYAKKNRLGSRYASDTDSRTSSNIQFGDLFKKSR